MTVWVYAGYVLLVLVWLCVEDWRFREKKQPGGTVSEAKTRCEKAAKMMDSPPGVYRARGIVYLPDGSRHSETLSLDTLLWS